jgi:Secretion system C-terminal sorting domain/PKD domain
MKTKLFLFVSLTFFGYSYAQESKEVLFLGNSYTYVNDLPQLLVEAAASVGDIVVKDQNTPGGYTLEWHSTNVTSLNKIKQGTWDFVVLQEQSQRPSLWDAYVEEYVYPFAQRLNDTIVKYNPCAETAFYMTWGRENGDPSNCSDWPPVCTYEGMDDLLRERYLIMANDNEAITSPVGAVWRYLRDNNLNIDLYLSDGSHPSLAGSYAASIAFYTVIFRKDPTLITFNSTLPADEASIIKDVVKLVVYDNLTEWYVGIYIPVADFTHSNNGNGEYTFINTSTYSTNYLWDFGDENSSTEENPIHTYTEEGEYTVTLTSNYLCENSSIKSETINVILGIDDFSIKKIVEIYPNPVKDIMNIETTSVISSIEVLNILGQVLYSEKTNTNKIQIDISAFSAGNYFVRVTVDNNTNVLQVIKK